MYDPFAPPPVPGTMQTAAVPQVPQVQPNPTPLAPNNALAALANRQRPRGPLAGFMGRSFDPQGFRQAVIDWRGQRPQFAYDPTMDTAMKDQRNAFQPQMQDWRDLRPSRRTFVGNPAPTGV